MGESLAHGARRSSARMIETDQTSPGMEPRRPACPCHFVRSRNRASQRSLRGVGLVGPRVVFRRHVLEGSDQWRPPPRERAARDGGRMVVRPDRSAFPTTQSCPHAQDRSPSAWHRCVREHDVARREVAR
jgi:hypothetical protein